MSAFFIFYIIGSILIANLIMLNAKVSRETLENPGKTAPVVACVKSNSYISTNVQGVKNG